MKIYTKTGDSGTTSLIGGKRVSKADLRVCAYGSVDELNSILGVLRAKLTDSSEKAMILEIQNSLFAVGVLLATPSGTEFPKGFEFKESWLEFLEKNIDEMQKKLPEIKNFIIYGEDELSALCHFCRSVARKVEREMIFLHEKEEINENLIKYINRLSDFLFIFARYLLTKEKNVDFFWKKDIVI